MANKHAEDIEELPVNPGDVEMGEGEEESASAALPFHGEDTEDAPAPRVPYVSYLASPVVTLTVGAAGESGETVLTAHQALLTQSPYFVEACAEFGDNGSPRRIDLSIEDVDAVGCFLEYLYTGDYFPRKIAGARKLESDPSQPTVDETGDQLLKHARVYTLAEKFQVNVLKSLASSKIHCVNSTAKGEIAYARYVYAHTAKDDAVIRAPVANFWAIRSHTLRSEAEDEFRTLCLEHPEFGYDVLTRVLDEKLKREQVSKQHPAIGGNQRKRPRHSQA